MAETQDKWGRSLVPCKWCGTPTAMTGTKMCDGCWELERRISASPELARRMLEALAAGGEPVAAPVVGYLTARGQFYASLTAMPQHEREKARTLTFAHG